MKKSKLLTSLVLGWPAVMPLAVNADAVSGELFFTTFSGGQNVHKVEFNYDGASSFTLGAPSNIASTPGADGIIFAPDGDLLIGGQGNAVHKVDPTTGAFTSVNAGGVSVFHMALDPSGTFAYGSGIPSPNVSTIPLSPSFANGTAHSIIGESSQITSIAFDATGQGFFTASGSGGFGSFGKFSVDGVGNFVTDVVYSSLPAAHGMTYDPLTGDLILMGDSTITQIDATSLTIVGNRVFSGVNFDQGTVDGEGHLFAASNTGHLLFMDYKASGDIDLDSFNSLQFLAASLDDVAPLVGPGSSPVPDGGSSAALLGIAAAGLAIARRKFLP